MTYRQVKLTDLIIDPTVQARAVLSDVTIAEYASAILEGAIFPQPIVYEVPDVGLVLADGRHRVEARKRAGKGPLIECDVRAGTMRDAIIFACGANWNHGLPRTNADKRKAVATLLSDPEWSAWSDSDIAKRCRVSHTFVGQMRAELAVTCNVASETSESADSDVVADNVIPLPQVPKPRTYNAKSGKTSTMRVGNIGKQKSKATADGDTSTTHSYGNLPLTKKSKERMQELHMLDGWTSHKDGGQQEEEHEHDEEQHGEPRQTVSQAWNMATEADRKEFSEQHWPEVQRLARRQLAEGDLIQWIDGNGKEKLSEPRRIRRLARDGFNVYVDNGTGGEMSIQATDCVLIAAVGEPAPHNTETTRH
jgi:hypothetical protein